MNVIYRILSNGYFEYAIANIYHKNSWSKRLLNIQNPRHLSDFDKRSFSSKITTILILDDRKNGYFSFDDFLILLSHKKHPNQPMKMPDWSNIFDPPRESVLWLLNVQFFDRWSKQRVTFAVFSIDLEWRG